MKLSNKVAIITGAASGIGRATAILFAGEGAKVAVVDMDEEGASITVDAIQKTGGEAIFIKCDVAVENEVKSMVHETVKKYGKIDILFNNAGIELISQFAATLEEQWDRVMDVNAKGVFLCSKHVVPVMKKNGSGAIVNAGSISGLVGTPLYVAYCASKGAVMMMTKALALELAPYGIRVNATCPAAIETPMMDREMQVSGKSREQSRKEWTALHPIGRMGRPEEVAHAVLFLATEDSSFITGSNLVIDGGYTAQ